MGITQADYDSLSDDDLFDMGMYRCKCGAAVYPQGDNAPHCTMDNRG